MDDRRFDHLARTVGAGVSRRGALAALAGLAAGGTALGGDARRRRRTCRKDSPRGQCCRRDGTCTCRNGGFACGNGRCGTCPAYVNGDVEYCSFLVPICDGGACACVCTTGSLGVGPVTYVFPGVSCRLNGECAGPDEICTDMVSAGPCGADSVNCCCLEIRS